MQRHPAAKQRHPLGRVIADNYKHGHGHMCSKLYVWTHLCVHPRGLRLRMQVKRIVTRETKPCKHHDSESAKTCNTRNHCKVQGKHAVARVCHALPDSAMPFWLDMQILYCAGIVPPRSGHDLRVARFNVVCLLHGCGRVYTKFRSSYG
jgi:hypothetical protein